ncbi:hypothetical protein MTER_09450 [Mycolicibacter terrae]|uniref:Uncharacterized protein n=1 Tax=Mycolicibacter terrae TaxID=1788 RepID=A0AAD1HUT8_9MYCO|nr:hypothetical protein [Mycolicibacter terrae]ORW95651.1 hypothetical protein AWC28_00575 [Mycolicibacter terrae]BBX21534.1 hypothetical protein MTER_09450 [Mycolicibacter terrae]SNV88184.1 Uncharacterised protein [Mycolicibacter terrae]
MSDLFGVARPHALARKGATLAAATVVAGAGLVGVATAGPELSGAPFAAVQHHVALVDFPTFAQSLQTLLDDMGMGDLNAVLGGFGTFTVDSPVSGFLAAFNPDGITLNGLTNLFGISLTEPLYSADPGVESILGTGSLFLVDGVPIGNLDLGDLIDVVLGDGAGGHSLTELADVVGLGTLLSQYGSMIGALGLENLNVLNCSISCGAFLSVDTHPDLTLNSSLVDWLSAIVGVPTTDVTQHVGIVLPTTTVVANSAYTLGEYLHTLPVSATDSTTMDNATLGLLFNMAPNQTWDEYVSNFPFGGTLFDPSGETWGEQTLGTLLSSFLPDDSTLAITGDTPITDILEAFGLLNW